MARGLIKLNSLYSKTTAEGIEHLVVDIDPGSGKFEGKVIGFIGFGKHQVGHGAAVCVAHHPVRDLKTGPVTISSRGIPSRSSR